MNVPGKISKWLREDGTVAATFGDRVYTVLPGQERGKPYAKVARPGGGGIVLPETTTLDDVRLQIDVWADRQAEAQDAADLVVESLYSLNRTRYEGASYSRVRVSRQDLPDDSLDPVLPRVILTVLLRVRSHG